MFACKRYLRGALVRSQRTGSRTTWKPTHVSSRAQGTSPEGGSDQTSSTNTSDGCLKSGDIYLHRQLGYRGIVLYPFTSKSTYYCEESGEIEEKAVDMYVTMLLNDINTRNHIEKYLTVMMVHHDGCFSNDIDLEGNNEDRNIVRAPLPGFDVVSQLDARPLIKPSGVTNSVKAPYLELFFNDDDTCSPKEPAINAWRKCYDLHEDSYTLRYNFKDDDFLAEFFIYPYDVFTKCNDRSSHVNSCYRYRLNVSMQNLDDRPDQSLIVGPVGWQIRGWTKDAKDTEQTDDTDTPKSSKSPPNHVEYKRSDFHTPIELNHRRRSAQFNGDLFLPKRCEAFRVTPLLVCRWIGADKNDENADTRTFQYPAFQIDMTKTDYDVPQLAPVKPE